MRITTSQSFDRPSSLMQQLTAKADALQTQIATTKRFTAPSEDAGAYAQLQSLKRASTDASAYSANIDLAQGLLAQADTALGSVETQLQRAQELASKAANDTYSESDRAAIKTELDTIRETLLALANSTDMRGQPMFGGATGDTAYVTNADGSVTYAGEGTPASIPVGDGYSVAPSVTGERAFASADGDIFSVLSALSAALGGEGDTSAAAQTAMAGIAEVQSNVALSRTSIGARAARLDLDAEAVTAADAARETSRATLEDTDIATTTVELQKALTALQATQSSFTKLSSLSLFDYLS
ncbi:flagellar hook-associated protein FlgL [Sphingomonas hengshuiensis]|uniref:Flagellin N-terminal domain-containing protein n=1 Tax=Sphingomonas hengshuiensis TaxID=1609977 RepID=A0A7U4JB16_9SPHN|nr:flagellar hook-associated protein FlgL [Sphingomonas hengshuiensis]AJP73526.1 hypothetical protein TS85_19640 [Sphingomonas hengshuiensis]